MTADSARLRAVSGAVEDDRPLVAFLYLLLRGHLPAGAMAELVAEAIAPAEGVVFTNGWLASYAQDCADRLTSSIDGQAHPPSPPSDRP